MALRLSKEIIEKLTKCIPLNTLKTEALGELLKVATSRIQLDGDILFEQGETEQIHLYLLDGSVKLSEFGEAIETISATDSKAKFPIGHQFPRKYTCSIKGRAEFIVFDSRVINNLLAADKGKDYQVDNTEKEAEIGDWMTQLLECGVFQKLPAANIQAVMMNMEDVEYKAGDSVVVQGDDGDYFYLIHQGRCVVLQDQGSGIDKEIVQLGPGQSFGEDSLLSNKPRNSTVRMLTSGTLVRLNKSDFVKYVKDVITKIKPFAELKKLKDEDETNRFIWLDIRSKEKFEQGAIEDSINVPLSTLRFQVSSLSNEHHYFIVGSTQENGALAAYILVDAGLEASILAEDFKSILSEYFSSDVPEKISHSTEKISPEKESISLENENTLLESTDDNELKLKLKQAVLTIRKMEEIQQKAQQRRQAEYKQIKINFDKAKTRLIASELDKQKALAIIQKLTAESAPLVEKLKQKESELEDATEKLNTLSSIKVQFKEQREENIRLSELISKLKEETETEINQLKEKLDDNKVETKQALDALKLSDKKVSQQIELLEELRKNIAEYKAKLETEEANSSRKEKEIETLKARINGFETEIEKLQTTLDEERNKQYDLLSQNKDELEHNSKEFQAQLELTAKLEAENKGLLEDLEKLNIEKKQDKKEYQKYIDTLEQDINELKLQAEQEQNILRDKLEALEAKRVEELEVIQTKLSKANEQIDIQQSDLTTKEQEIQSLQQYLNEIENERQTLRDTLDQEHKTQLKNKADAQDLGQERQHLLEVQQQLTEERNKLREKLDELQKEREISATTYRDEINQFEKEIAKIKHEAEDDKIQLQHKIEAEQLEKTEQSKILEIKLAEITEKLNKKEAVISNNEKALAALQTRHTDLESQLTEVKKLLDIERKKNKEKVLKHQEYQQQMELEKKEISDALAVLMSEQETYRKKLALLQKEKEQLGVQQNLTTADLEKELVQSQQEAETKNAELKTKLEDVENEKLKLQQTLVKIKEQSKRLEDKLKNALNDTVILREIKDGIKAQFKNAKEKIYQVEESLEAKEIELKKAKKETIQAEKAKEAAQKHSEALITQVNSLRSVLEQYVDQIQSQKIQYTEEEVNEIESLKTELDMVREQASSDVSYMKKELQKAQQRLKLLKQS